LDFSSLALKTAAKATASRTLATSAKPKLPVQLYGLHARYANATYLAAAKTNSLETVETELNSILSLSKTNAEFGNFMSDPTISRAVKADTMEKLLSGGKANDVTLNLLSAMAANARLKDFKKVVDNYGVLMKAHRGEVSVLVKSAEPLTKGQMSDLEKSLTSLVGVGKKALVTAEVDPALVGGLTVQVGDKFLDLSVASRIEELSRTVV